MLLSIITINYNNGSGLQKTMESVINQTSDEFEYIIVDGVSTDNSKDLIFQYSNIPKNFPFRWVSEPDSGIYNAMNKGIRMAKGQYLHFLNSGDWLVDESVVENMLNSLTDCDILVGNVVSITPKGGKRYYKIEKDVSCLTFYQSTLPHTSAYISKSLFDIYGLYDESLKIVSDWKFYLLAIGLNSATIAFTDIYVSYFDTTGLSNTNIELEKLERRKVLQELIPPRILYDYDKYHFDILQMERIKNNRVIYSIFWFVERCLFKIEKYTSRNGISKK